MKGGTTAPFLRSDQKGDALIEKLIDTENMAEGSKVSKEEVVQEVISHKEVLDSLENEEVIEVRAKEANTEQRVSKEADSSVIDSLVEGQGNVEDDPQDTK